MMIAGAALADGAANPPRFRDVTEQNVSQYVEFRLRQKFPGEPYGQLALYEPAIIDSIGAVEALPAEDEIGIPDGPAGLKARADYVLSGLYVLRDNETVDYTRECGDPLKPSTCDDLGEARTTSGLHFAAPMHERPHTVTLAHNRVTFDGALDDALAMDRLADSMKGTVEPIKGLEGVLYEIGKVLPYFVRIGLIPSLDDAAVPISVSWIDMNKYPSLTNVAAFVCTSAGAGYCGAPGEMHISDAYAESDKDEDRAYLRHVIAHETTHLQNGIGVLDETGTELASLTVDGLMERDGAKDHLYGAIVTLRQDALWTATLIMDYPGLTIPTNFAERDKLISTPPFTPYYWDYAPDSGDEDAPAFEKVSDEVNGKLDGALRGREQARVDATIDEIYRSETADSRAAFDDVYDSWKQEDHDTMYSRAVYKIAIYGIIHEEEQGDGLVTEVFVQPRNEYGYPKPASDCEKMTLDIGPLIGMIEEAREVHDNNGNR